MITRWDQLKAVLLCLMVVSSAFAQNEQDNTYYFNAEVTRYLSYHSDSWIFSSTLSTLKKKSFSEKSSPTPLMLSRK